MCSNDAICGNTAGSYTCECVPGYSGDGYSCTGKIDMPSEMPCLAMVTRPSSLCPRESVYITHSNISVVFLWRLWHGSLGFGIAALNIYL